MPSREAVSRSMSIAVMRARTCRSEFTSAMLGMRRIRSSIRGANSRRLLRSLERMPNWYCARDWVVAMLIDWMGWKKMLMPGTVAVDRRSRATTSSAVDLRSDLSFRVTKMRPELTVLAALPPPTVDMTVTTSGSRLMTSANTACRATMASNEASSGPTVAPVSWPISSDGKKPLGMFWNSTAVSTKVPSVTASTIFGIFTTRRRAHE